MRKISLLLITILILSSCNSEFEVVQESKKIGELCTENADCELPMEFAVQSNCPFGAACIDSKCKVVCPMSFHDPSPEISKTYPYTCEINTECDCSERENRTLACLCVQGKCLSVEAE